MVKIAKFKIILKEKKANLVIYLKLKIGFRN